MVPKIYQLTLVNSLLGRQSHDGHAGAAVTGTITSGGASQPSPRTVRSGVYVHTVRQVRVDDAFGAHDTKAEPISLHPLASPTSFDEEEKREIGDGFTTPPSERVQDFA